MKKTTRFLAIILLILALQACTFEEPTLPTWFSEFRIPIPNQEVLVAEVVNDSTIIDTTDSGEQIIAISIRDTLESQKVSQSDLAIKPESDRLSRNIGDIQLNDPPTEESEPVTVQELFASPLVPGAIINVPDTVVNAPPRYLTFQDFDTIAVQNGTMHIEFYNNSFLNIRNDMRIRIYNRDETSSIGEAFFSQPIDSFSTAFSEPVDISGRSFSNYLRFEMVIPLESDSHLLSVADTSSEVHFTASFTNLNVRYASAVIPQQDFTVTDSVSLAEEEDQIITTQISEGDLNLEIENRLPVSANLTIQLLNFYTDPGYDPASVKTEQYQLLANTVDIVEVNLNDLYVVDYENGPNPGQIIDYFDFRVLVETIPSGGEYVQINENDSIIVRVNIVDSIYVRSFTGIIDTIDIELDPQEQNDLITFDGLEGSFFFDDLIMDLNIYNEIGIDLQVNLNITAYKNNRSESFSLQFDPNPFTVDANQTGQQQQKTTIRLDRNNSNIVELVEFLPEDIVVSGQAVIAGEGSVTLDDELWADYEIYSPFYLRLENDPRYQSEIESQSFSDGVRNSIRDGDVQDTRLHVDLYNGLPLGAQLIIYAAIDSTDLFSDVITDSSTKLIIDDIIFTPGTDLDSDGFVDQPASDELEITLSDDEIQVFSNETVYISSEIVIDNSDGTVKVRSTDKISANGNIRIRFRLSDE